MWCVAELDAEYIRKMEDLLARYEQPDDPKEPVVCLDEKPISLHAECDMMAFISSRVVAVRSQSLP